MKTYNPSLMGEVILPNTSKRPTSIAGLPLKTRVWLLLLPFICILAGFIISAYVKPIKPQPLSAEQHIARISEIMKMRVGQGTYWRQTGFSVSLLHSFDCPAEPHETCWDYDYFLIQFEPYGYMFGFIQENKYYYDVLTSHCLDEQDGLNPFERAGIAEDCRYMAYMWRGLHKFAARMQDGLVDIETGLPVSEEEARAWNSNAGLFQSALPERAGSHAYLIFEFD